MTTDELSTKIRGDLAAQGRGTVDAIDAARNEFLQSIAPAPDPSSVPSTVDVINRINEKTQGMSFYEAQQFKADHWRLVQNTPQYQQMQFADQEKIRNRFMTQLGTDQKAYFESLDPNDPNNEHILEMYNRFEGMRNGEDVDLNGWESFGKSFVRNSTTGGLLFGLGDKFTDVNLKDKLIGVEATEMENLMMNAAERFSPQEALDYKRGRVFGTMAGIGVDIAATVLLGGVTGATAKGLELGMSAQKAFGTASFAARQFGKLARVVVPNALDASIFVGETAVNRAMNNELDSNEDIKEFVKDIPGTFAKGMAYSIFGGMIFSGMAHAVGSSRRGAVNALEKAKDAVPVSKKEMAKAASFFEGISEKEAMANITDQTTEKGLSFSRMLIRDTRKNMPWTPENFAKRVNKYVDAGMTQEGAEHIVRNQMEASFLKDPDKWFNESEMNRQALYMTWGADAELTKSGDLRFKSFLDKPLDKPVVVSNNREGLEQFFKAHYEGQWNKHLEEVRLASGFKTGKVHVSIELPGETSRSVKLNSSSVYNTFRPGDTVTNKTQIEDIVNKISPNRNIKVEILEGKNFYKGFDYKADTIFIPKTVDSAAKSIKFAEHFFDQLKEISAPLGKSVDFDIKGIKALLNMTTDLKYNKSFFGKMGRKFLLEQDAKGYKVLLDGEVLKDGKGIKRFTTPDEAINYTAKQVHIEEFGGLKGLQETLSYKGVSLEMKGGKIAAKINGDDYKVFNTMEDVLEDPHMRPGLPYSKRPETFDINVFGDGTAKKTYVNDNVSGTIEKFKKSETIIGLSSEMKDYQYVRKGSYKLKDSGIEGVDVYTNGSTTTVIIPETGFTKEFTSVSAAQHFLENFEKRYTNVLERAGEYGLITRPTQFGWAIGNDYEMHFVKSLDDVEKIISRESSIRVRDIADQHVIADAMKTSDKGLERLNSDYKRVLQERIAKRNQRARQKKSSRIQSWWNRAAKQSGARIRDNGNPESMRLFQVMQNSYRMMDNHTTTIDNEIEKIFKGFDDKELHFMGMILQREIHSGDWKKAAEEMNKVFKTNYKVDSRFETALNKAKDMFSQGGLEFGVDGGMWVQNYSPRFANKSWQQAFEVSAEGEDLLIGNDKLRQLLKANKIPDQEVPFFMHMRADEASTNLVETNVKHMLQNYYHIGIRTTYMKDPMEQLRKFASQIGNDPLLREDMNVMKQMLDSINGRVVDTPTAQAAHSLNEIKRTRQEDIFGKIFGKEEGSVQSMEEAFGTAMEQNGQDFGTIVKRLEGIDAMKSSDRFHSAMINGALMAWNARMPIRNIGQVYTNLAPIVGVRYTNRAVRDILSSKSLRKRLMDEGIEAGIINPDKVLTKMRNATDLAERNVNLGMYAFRRSDDFTRLVSMRATELRTQDAISLVKLEIEKGVFDPKSFLRKLSADYLDEGSQAKILDMVAGKNNPSGVLNELGIDAVMKREITTMTMYDYTPHLRPEMFRSKFGQIFGKMGTWPVAYFDLMKRGVQARGVEFVTKIAAAQAAMGFIYNDVLDMNGVAYTPLGNMTYMGGPALEGIPRMVGGATSALGGLFTGKMNPIEAGKTLAKNSSFYLPFYKQARSVNKSLEAIQNDEYREGILYGLGANPEWNGPGLAGMFGLNIEPDSDYNFRSWWDGIYENFEWGKEK